MKHACSEKECPAERKKELQVLAADINKEYTYAAYDH
jgi:hypothetical protein